MLPIPLPLHYSGQSTDDNGSPMTGAEASWSDVVPSLAGKTVVVVEDEGITQLQIRKALTLAGMKVLGLASDGASGVQLALRTRPQLVLMDIKMPGEIDGLEAIRQILGEFSTCVIVLTAYDDFRDEAREAGACGYVVKPVTSQSLIPEVKEASDRFYAA